MQKIAKRGFRGERKRNPHPVPLPRRGGMWWRGSERDLPLYTYSALADFLQRGKLWRVIYSVSPRTPEGGQVGKGDKPSSYHILRSRGTHIQ